MNVLQSTSYTSEDSQAYKPVDTKEIINTPKLQPSNPKLF